MTTDNPARKDRLAWLAKDFRTTAFNRADRIDEAHLQRSTREGALHLGIIVVHFPSCTHLDAARKAIANSRRSNFRLPVLTLFRSSAHGHDLVFLLSETPVHPTAKTLLDDPPPLVRKSTPCSPAPKSKMRRPFAVGERAAWAVSTAWRGSRTRPCARAIATGTAGSAAACPPMGLGSS